MTNDRLLTLEMRIRGLHKPFRIYGECGHAHTEGEAGVDYIEDIGLTCNYEYSICTECCVDSLCGQSEACISNHKHGTDQPICATIALLINLPSA